MPCRQDVASGVHVGMGRVSAGNTLEPGLARTILLCHVVTGRCMPETVWGFTARQGNSAPSFTTVRVDPVQQSFPGPEVQLEAFYPRSSQCERASIGLWRMLRTRPTGSAPDSLAIQR